MKKLYTKISKFLSYILRHGSNKIGIELDDSGFANLNEILLILNNKFKGPKITRVTLEDLIKKSDKQRFEIYNNKIRAFYGHSFDKKILMKEIESIPSQLYHGTSKEAYEKIKLEGLKKKNRQYVHLSESMKTAFKVGERKSKTPIILTIDVKSAQNEGVKFFKSGDMYLADFIPPKYLKPEKL